MAQKPPPIRIVRGKDLEERPMGQDGIIQLPATVGLAMVHETDVPISASDIQEGTRRGLPTNEAVDLRVKTIGPKGGEAWHVHMSYYDIFFYILSGQGIMWWEENGQEHHKDFGSGDFVHMSPKAKHQWLNTGNDDLKLVEFRHFHNYEEA